MTTDDLQDYIAMSFLGLFWLCVGAASVPLLYYQWPVVLVFGCFFGMVFLCGFIAYRVECIKNKRWR